MKSRFIISENDRRNILSMYGLLTEEEKEYTFAGTVKNESDKPVELVKIIIKKQEKDGALRSVGGGNVNEDGSFEFNIKLDNLLEYYFIIEKTGYLEFKEKIDLSVTSQPNLKLVLKKKKEIKDLKETTNVGYRITNINLKVVDKNNTPLTDYDLQIITDGKDFYNKNINEDELTLNVLSNDLIFEDLEINKEYEMSPNDQNFFNDKTKNTIKVIVKKEEYDEKEIDFVLNKKNASVTLLTNIIDGKDFLIKTGNEDDISVANDDKNEIVIRLDLSIPDTLKSLEGQLKLKPESNIITNVDEFQSGPNGINLVLYGYKKGKSGIDDGKQISSTTSKGDGTFEFIFKDGIKLSEFDYLQINASGNSGFRASSEDLDIKTIKNNDTFRTEKEYDLGYFILNKKKEVSNIKTIPTITSFCKNYVSSKSKIYGFGSSKNISNKDALNDAIKNAVINLVKYHPKYDEYSTFIFNDDKTYKIVCNKADITKREVVVKLIPKEIKKYTKKVIEDRESPKINFRNLDFLDAISISKETNKNIFLLFTGDDSNSKKILEKFNSNSKMVSDVNNNFVPLNYVVDTSQKNKYLIASENLKVFTYPYLTILKGIEDPNNVDDINKSYRVIDRYGLVDDLMNINNVSF